LNVQKYQEFKIMKKNYNLKMIPFLAIAIFTATAFQTSLAQSPRETLTNSEVLELVRSGFSEDLIIAKIKASDANFDTTTDGIKLLKKSGVSDSLILQMVQKNSTARGDSVKTNKSVENSGAVQDGKTILLPDATPVKLRISRTISSADAKTGDTIDFEVLEDIKIGDVLIIPKNSTAIGTVTQAKPKGRMGKGGKLDINIDYLRLTSGEKIALRAVKETKGSGSTGVMTGAIVASSILFFPAAPFFLFMKGKDITIPKGTDVTAYVNGDVNLDLSKL
jgi:hypothetical protein